MNQAAVLSGEIPTDARRIAATLGRRRITNAKESLSVLRIKGYLQASGSGEKEGAMSSIGGISVLVLILVLSFAIDRVVRAVLFLLSFLHRWTQWVPDPPTIEDPANRTKAEKRQKLVYFAFAGFLGLIVVAVYGDVRVIKALGYDANKVLDTIATGIILMGGSDFISKLLQMSGIGGGTESSPQPIEITGKLILESSNIKKIEEQ